MFKILKITAHPVVDFAAEELKKYLRMMMPRCGEIPISYDPQAKEGFRLGLMEDFGLDISEAEIAPFISLDCCIRSFKEYCRIRMILIKHDCSALQWFQRVAVLYNSCNHHGVDDITCREYKSETRVHVTLIVVTDSICKVKCICLVRVKI